MAGQIHLALGPKGLRLRKEELHQRRERLIRQLFTADQEREAEVYQEFSDRRMLERRKQAEMEKTRSFARQQNPQTLKKSQTVEPIDVCGGSGDGKLPSIFHRCETALGVFSSGDKSKTIR